MRERFAMETILPPLLSVTLSKRL